MPTAQHWGDARTIMLQRVSEDPAALRDASEEQSWKLLAMRLLGDMCQCVCVCVLRAGPSTPEALSLLKHFSF